jgi:predicted protein tyrosine phosphatase
MSHLEICSLNRLHKTVESAGASHILTLINAQTPVARPATVEESNHLYLAMSDILEPLDGHIIPAETHVERLIAFVRNWDRARPMVIHCYAGVSRSTAAALITASILQPSRSAMETARMIRERSPTATPNLRLVAVADRLLGQKGAMSAAAESIGRGEDCFEGVPFKLEL